MTPGDKRHDVTVARTLRLEPGSIVIMDRGYLDYGWYAELTAQGVFFVTHSRSNMVYEVVEERPLPERSQIRRDQIVRLTGRQLGKGCPYELRRVEVFVPEKVEIMVFQTNHFQSCSHASANANSRARAREWNEPKPDSRRRQVDLTRCWAEA